MKVFVGYGYSDRDKWIEEEIFDLIRAFGGEPVSGKELYGRELEDGVREKIKECDALIGFATRRDKMQNGKYTTHRWVTDEIKTANEWKIPFVEVRETDVDPQGGSVGGRQHIVCDSDKKEKCVVEIATALSKWRLTSRVKLQLLPDKVVRCIRPYLGKKGLRCTYRVLKGNVESSPKKGSLVPMKGGLFALVPPLDRLALIQIKIEANAKGWTSGYESADVVGIQLEEV
jgi:hypothetical protein